MVRHRQWLVVPTKRCPIGNLINLRRQLCTWTWTQAHPKSISSVHLVLRYAIFARDNTENGNLCMYKVGMSKSQPAYPDERAPCNRQNCIALCVVSCQLRQLVQSPMYMMDSRIQDGHRCSPVAQRLGRVRRLASMLGPYCNAPRPPGPRGDPCDLLHQATDVVKSCAPGEAPLPVQGGPKRGQGCLPRQAWDSCQELKAHLNLQHCSIAHRLTACLAHPL